MKDVHYLKKAVCLILALILLSGCDSNIASTIRLEKAQGTIGVENEKDVRIEFREGMQLYSGYEVGTAQLSKAWISLDDTKSIKMDEVTTALVSLSGKDLKITLEEGKLFFNVSEPLAEDESFSIETSTMLTGIRGTCGWVEVVDAYTTRVVVLEGTVVTQSYDPVTGELRLTAVTGGQILTVVYHGQAGTQANADSTIQGLISGNVIIAGNIIHSESGLRIEELQEQNIPPFVQEEIAASQQLQDKIAQNSPLSVPDILDQASEEASQETPEPSSGEAAPQEQPSEAPEQPDPPSESQAPSQPPPTPPAEQVPPVTEVYYEKHTYEWTETVPIDQAGNTVTAGIDGAGTPTGGSGTTPPGETTTTEETTRVYRPLIQLLPNDRHPSTAIITDAYEIITSSVTRDSQGNVVSSTELSSTVEVQDGNTQTVPVLSNSETGMLYINFEDPEGNLINLIVGQDIQE